MGGTCEKVDQVDVRKLYRNGDLHMAGDRYLIRYRYWDGQGWRDVSQYVSLHWTKCNFGGERPYWVCPQCGHNRAVMYLVPNPKCRECAGLQYLSQRGIKSDRDQKAARKAEQRLIHGRPGWGQETSLKEWDGTKPKGMHWKTFKRLYAAHRRELALREAQLAAGLMRLKYAKP